MREGETERLGKRKKEREKKRWGEAEMEKKIDK